MRITTVILAPLLLLVVGELALRVFGWGYSTRFLVPAGNAGAWTINEKFPRRFYPNSDSVKSQPFLLPRHKPADAARIFVLGESAALGTPNPAFGFSRILEVMLREQYPNRPIEVYNAAMRGINSHIILPAAKECARHQPDVCIVFMGNNEVAGLHGPGPENTVLDRHLALIRLTAFVKGTRLGQLMMSALASTNTPKQDMEFFRAHRVPQNHPGRELVYAHFRANLEGICEAMTRAGAKVVLSTVPVNLKDFPPLASMPREGLAAETKAEWDAAYEKGMQAERAGNMEEAARHFEKALSLDDQPADLHFRLARCQHALKRLDAARQHYRLARDRDALQVRTDTRLNEITKEIASKWKDKGVMLCDAEEAFARSELSEDEIPGQKLFNDHVHMRFSGDYTLAKTFCSALPGAYPEKFGKPAKDTLPAAKQCADSLGYNQWEEIAIETSMARQMASPPFLDQMEHKERMTRSEQAIKKLSENFTSADWEVVNASYQNAIGRRPDDWQLHANYGAFLLMKKDLVKAIPHLEVPVQVFPNILSLRIKLANALARAGRRDEAIKHLREALRIDPKSSAAQSGMAALTGGRKN